MSKLKVHVEDWNATAARVAETWHRAERGEPAAAGHHLSFRSWDTLAAVLTVKRLELLRHLHRRPTTSIAELARALNRDYRRVHDDVERLLAAGLIDRTSDGLRAEYDAIQTTIAM